MSPAELASARREALQLRKLLCGRVKIARMSAHRRLTALSRHLEDKASGGGASLQPRSIYLWLTRDNVELRDQMLEFLKASLDKPETLNHRPATNPSKWPAQRGARSAGSSL